jgi:DNA-binding response OmpR family regulator
MGKGVLMVRILIVEDDKFLSDLYQDLLTGEGYQVEIAEDGEVGEKKMAAGGYDLVLLDIMMPKKDGLTVLKTLTDDQKKKSGQIVMLTNLGQEAIIKEGFSLGAAGYLIKSALAPDQVLSEIRNFLSSDQTGKNTKNK